MTTASAHDVDLLAVVDESHDLVLAALEDPQVGGLSAVTWCSEHLVAADRVLYAAAQRRVPDWRRRVRAARAADHALQQALCRLDRRLTGDLHLAVRTVDALAEQVRQRLRVHADAERRLVAALVDELAPQEQQELADRLAAATAAAPTRPHPHTRHTPLSALVARVDAVVDRARDVLDNRTVPSDRHARRIREPGRWGCYLMGAPFPPTSHGDQADAGPTPSAQELP